MSRSPSRVVGASVAALLTTGVLVPASSTTALAATLVSESVVITEVYGGGGNSGATYTHDFVELVNTSSEPVSLDGWSVQYFSAAGNPGSRVTLAGTVAPGGHYLVQGAAGTGGTQALPTPDATGTFAASASNGTFALVSNSQTATLDRSAPDGGDPDLVDLVGYGTATQFSGDAAAPALTNATSGSRVAFTGDNATDFVTGAPSPQNSSAAPVGPTDPTVPVEPTDPVEPTPTEPVTIAQIQGTGDASPYAGATVTTRGVVTAVYAEGGINGFVVQEGGTGGELDPARAASDALFVYGKDAAATVAVGDSVEVTGPVSEYHGQTQISASASAVTKLAEPLAPVSPTSGEFPRDAAGREALESMLFAPAGDWTVTDTYATNKFGEVSLVPGTAPLRQPGDMMAPGPEASALYASQLDSVVLLDDGRNVNFTTDTGERETLSWISTEEPVRVGAAATFTDPVIVSFGFDQWRFVPTHPWESEATDGVDFEDTRTAAPREVGGDVQVGSFNVLNYFTTLGADTAGCTPYTDVDGEGTTVRGGCLLRGAWGADDLERQTQKIVSAIERVDASVLGLTEIENSARLGEEPDEALAHLVGRLNEAAGTQKWAYVPTAEVMAAIGADAADQDVITNAIIYQPAEVSLVEARIHADDPAFDNARDPIGAVFEPLADGVEGEEFFFVVNHFKSKGSADAGDAGTTADPVVGNAETSRLAQGESLRTWVGGVQQETGVEDVFLAGDFNAYTMERPLQGFYDAGWTNLAHTFDPGSWSYTFGSRVGSLDHVLANEGALERTTDAAHWMINSPESVMLQYGRHRNNVRDLHDAGPYASSDHDPVIAGVRAGAATGPTDPVQPRDPNVLLSDANSATPDVSFRIPLGAEVLVGDWDGDGVDTLAWRVGNRFTFASSNSADAELTGMWYGLPSDEPVVGDWDGDGVDTIGVRRGNQFHLRNDVDGGDASHVYWYGTPQDVVVAGDFDGDGADSVSVRRGNALHVNDGFDGGNADRVVYYGTPQDVVIAGDLDGNGTDELAVRRGDRFHLRYSLTTGDADLVVPFGRAEDVPLIGDWDGNGVDTIGVARPATGA